MYSYHYKLVEPRTYICAFAFCFAILAFLAGCIALSFTSAGPVVLGTEMNVDGSIEYLCLGTGCESISS